MFAFMLLNHKTVNDKKLTYAIGALNFHRDRCVSLSGEKPPDAMLSDKPGHHLREWRRYRRLTQDAAAEHVERPQSSISRVERGWQPYDQILLEKLAALYNCSVIELISINPGKDFSIDALVDG